MNDYLSLINICKLFWFLQIRWNRYYEKTWENWGQISLDTMKRLGKFVFFKIVEMYSLICILRHCLDIQKQNYLSFLGNKQNSNSIQLSTLRVLLGSSRERIRISLSQNGSPSLLISDWFRHGHMIKFWPVA